MHIIISLGCGSNEFLHIDPHNQPANHGQTSWLCVLGYFARLARQLRPHTGSSLPPRQKLNNQPLLYDAQVDP
ncbi:MAG: hypothetical protein CMJ75_03330 [Planctomycetaceae bacterium]|nr:hypothetical protein [Planctomycetaceae bacterium]